MKSLKIKNLFYLILVAQLFYWSIIKQVTFPHLIPESLSFFSIQELWEKAIEVSLPFVLSIQIFFAKLSLYQPGKVFDNCFQS